MLEESFVSVGLIGVGDFGFVFAHWQPCKS
jgi:hypothetical protein